MIPSVFSIRMPEVHTDKVAVIRAVRQLTQMGLKEAKDLSEQPGRHLLKLNVHAGHNYSLGREASAEENFKQAVSILRSYNVKVQMDLQLEGMVNRLRQLACEAVLCGQNDFARSLLDVLSNYECVLPQGENHAM